MRKLILVLSLSTLSSCGYINDFYREQRMKDADTQGKSTLIESESSKKALIEQAKAENGSLIMYYP